MRRAFCVNRWDGSIYYGDFKTILGRVLVMSNTRTHVPTHTHTHTHTHTNIFVRVYVVWCIAVQKELKKRLKCKHNSSAVKMCSQIINTVFVYSQPVSSVSEQVGWERGRELTFNSVVKENV